MNTTRSAAAAARGSCVTITVVWPSSSTASRSSARISPPEAESRLPVGSSANSTVGWEISARAIATRCCWPPESSDGRWPRRSVRPTRAISASTSPRSGLRPAIDSGSRMFSSAVSIGSRLNCWNTKPMWRRRSFVSCLSLIRVMSSPPITTVPDGRGVEAGEQVHQRGLAGARGAHDGRELAGGDLERDAAKGVDGGLAVAVAAGDRGGRDGRRRGRCVEGSGSDVEHVRGVLWGGVSSRRRTPRGRSGRGRTGARPRTAARRWPRRAGGR